MMLAAAVVTLVVSVVLDGPRPRPEPVDAPDREAVLVTRFSPVVDGVLEAEWSSVPEAPPLEARELGRVPPAARARVALSEDALVVAAPALGRRWSQTWVLDPDGLGQAWWEVSWSQDGSTRSRCGFDGLHFVAPAVVPSRALPCAPSEVPRLIVGTSGAEVVFPRDALTSAGRLLWLVEGPDGAAGTWSPGGKGLPLPEHGRALAVRAVAARVVAVPDPDAQAWRVSVSSRRPLPGGDWAWRVVGAGAVVASGTFVVETPVSPVQFDVPWHHRPGLVLEVRGPDTPLGVHAAWTTGLGDPEPDVWVRTPVAHTRIELGFLTPAPLPARRVEVWAGRRRLAAGTVDVPAGSGRLVVEGLEAWGAVSVRVEGLLDDGRVWMTR